MSECAASDPVCCGGDRSERSRSPLSRVIGRLLRSDEMKSDKMVSDDMRCEKYERARSDSGLRVCFVDRLPLVDRSFTLHATLETGHKY